MRVDFILASQLVEDKHDYWVQVLDLGQAGFAIGH
jgi:hypothetical protein